jgi:lysozyme
MAWPMMGSLLLGCSGASGAAIGGGEPTGCTSAALEQCPSQSVEGIDVYDGQGTVDWAAVAGGGIAFAMIKATQGTYDTQATFGANWSGARRAGVRRGAYHFFDPYEDGAAQAQQYLATVGPLVAGDLPPMLDIECPDGDPDCLGTGGMGDTRDAASASPTAIAQRMWDWVHTVEGATGMKPIVYTFASYFASSGIDTAGLEAYPLFLAEVPSTAPGNNACFAVPAPWSRATMWQYSWSGTVPGIEGLVDRDRFLGSLADLQAFALGGGGAARPPGEADLDAAMPDADSTGPEAAADSDLDAARGADPALTADGGLVLAADGGPGQPVGVVPPADGGAASAWPGPPGCF